MIKKILHKIGFHFYKFHHGTGVNAYYECSICDKRKVVIPLYCEIYQPIDYDWLANKSDSFNHIPI